MYSYSNCYVHFYAIVAKPRRNKWSCRYIKTCKMKIVDNMRYTVTAIKLLIICIMYQYSRLAVELANNVHILPCSVSASQS